MKIAFITTDWASSDGRHRDGGYGGVGYYRCVKPAEYLRKKGHDVDVIGSDFKEKLDQDIDAYEAYKKFVKDYDKIVIKQADNRMISYMIGACHEVGVPIIMDIDDNFMEVFENQPALKEGYDTGGAKKAYAAAAMSMCDAIFVSTEPLKEYFTNMLQKASNIDMPIYVLPNCNDLKDWKHTTTTSDKFFIGWHGSITHDDDLMTVLPAIKEIMEENEDVYLNLMGGIREESVPRLFKGFDDLAKRILVVQGTHSWKGFPELLMQMPFDIGIAPLVDNEFNRAKSHIKWLEYAMMKIPTVAADVAPYSNSIDNGKTGFIYKNKKEFKEIVEKLIKDKELRDKVGETAYDEVENFWQYKDKVFLWEEALKNVSKSANNIKK